MKETTHPNKPNPQVLACLLENFSSIEFDGIEIVSISQEKAGSFWDDTDMEDCEVPVTDETVIIRLSTEDEDDYYFREEDIRNGTVVIDPDTKNEVLVTQDTAGNERKLTIWVEIAASFAGQPPIENQG